MGVPQCGYGLSEYYRDKEIRGSGAKPVVGAFGCQVDGLGFRVSSHSTIGETLLLNASAAKAESAKRQSLEMRIEYISVIAVTAAWGSALTAGHFFFGKSNQNHLLLARL